MPPSKNEILSAVEKIVARRPQVIIAKSELALLVMRDLKTTSSYAAKILGELVREGQLEKIRIAPGGFAYLTQETREELKTILVYLHPSNSYGDPASGSLYLESHGLGHLWKGNSAHTYLTTPSAWKEMKTRLAKEAAEKAVTDQQKREARRKSEQANLEAAVPGYAEALEALTKLVPGIEIRIAGAAAEHDDPDLWATVEGFRVSDLKKIVALVQRGLSAS